MNEGNTCYLGLGSNIGFRTANIKSAMELVRTVTKTKFIRMSSLIETKPFGYTEQPNFMNCVVEISTELKPQKLLTECLRIENKLGRERLEKWGPRNIDIDILFYATEIIDTRNLTIPHPEMHKRIFVLNSLMELCPDFIHPKINKTIKEIFDSLD
jgi:2-amino-4-hydroxy-6-hydroxymethyldihydropteridine diphosphokinase